jgi:hypothetical protein
MPSFSSPRAPRLACAASLAVIAGCSNEPVDAATHCPAREPIECAIDVGGRLPLSVGGSTVGAEDGYRMSRCGIGGGEAVEDAAYRWTAPRAGRYRFSTEGSAFDTTLSVRAGSCGTREMMCNDDASTDATHSIVTLDLDECETITLVVDGHDLDGVGTFALVVTSSEPLCDDGTDDDRDGLTDCDDPDCFGPRCDIVDEEWPDAWEELERGVLAEVNRVRAAGAVCDGVEQPPAPALERNALLEHAARLHSLDMTDQAYFSHDSLDGRTLTDRIADVGFTGPPPVGENIAWGATTAEEVMDGWMNSPGHCLNIMDPSFRTLGVGYAEGADGNRWTQDFAGGH